MSQSFKSLPEEFYREALIAKFELIAPQQELVVMNKLGGSKPFFLADETWPHNEKGEQFTFICQFQHPIQTQGQLARFFINVNNLEEYQFDIIDPTQPHQINVPEPKCLCLPCHQIKAWKKKRELISSEAIFRYYIEHVDLFQKDFAKELLDEFEITNLSEEKLQRSVIHSLLAQEYLFNDHKPSDATLKVGGVPFSEEGNTQDYLDEGTFLQLCSQKQFPLPFSVGHIMTDNLNFVYEAVVDDAI